MKKEVLTLSLKIHTKTNSIIGELIMQNYLQNKSLNNMVQFHIYYPKNIQKFDINNKMGNKKFLTKILYFQNNILDYIHFYNMDKKV